MTPQELSALFDFASAPDEWRERMIGVIALNWETIQACTGRAETRDVITYCDYGGAPLSVNNFALRVEWSSPSDEHVIARRRPADAPIVSSAAPSPKIAADSAPEFELRNDPPRPRRATFHDNEAQRQRVLIDGLHCLPGQLDLF